MPTRQTMADMPKQQAEQMGNGDGEGEGVSLTNEEAAEKTLSGGSDNKNNSNNQEEAVAVAAPAGVVSRSSKRLREPTETTTTTADAADADVDTNGSQDPVTHSLEPEGKRTRLGRAAKAQAVAKPMDTDSDDMRHTRMKIIVDGVLVDASESPPNPQSQEQLQDRDNNSSTAVENNSKDTAEATTTSTNTPVPATATSDLHTLHEQQLSQLDEPSTTATITTEAAAPGESTDSNNNTRWKAHQMAEDYIDLASNLMLYPTSQLGPYGYSLPSSSSSSQQQQQQRYPLQAVSALGYLKGSFRRPTVIEQWSPYEIAVFEAAVGHYGKDFHAVQKEISSKSCREVIDFYYIWKKTAHYERWKKSYVPPHLDVSLDDEV